MVDRRISDKELVEMRELAQLGWLENEHVGSYDAVSPEDLHAILDALGRAVDELERLYSKPD